MYCLFLALLQLLIIADYSFYHLVHHCHRIVFLTEFQQHRRWVGSIADPYLLIDIDANAHDTLAEPTARKRILDQHSAYLIIAAIYVVRPFDRHVFHTETVEGFGNGETGDFRDDELLPDREERRTKQHAECDVAVVLRLPAVAHLTASSRLPLRVDHVIFVIASAFGNSINEKRIGRFCLKNMYFLHRYAVYYC